MISETFVVKEEPPSIDPEASFSFSDEEEDTLFDRQTLSSVPTNTSFRLKIRKGDQDKAVLNKHGAKESDPIQDSISILRTNSYPVTQKEKFIGRLKKRDTDNNGSRNGLQFHRGNYYDSKSWRSQNVSGRASHIREAYPNRKEELVVIEQKEKSYLDSLFSICTFFFSVQEDDREIHPSTSSFEGHRQPSEDYVAEALTEKDYKTHFQTCVDAINSGNYASVVKLIDSVPGLVTFQSSKYQNKNLLHLIGSIDQSISLDLMTHATKVVDALHQTDRYGCVPLHYAASVGRNETLVKMMLCEWNDGTMAANADGDLPLHVAVWNGIGNDEIVTALIEANPNALLIRNNAGGTPLHLSCCGAQSPSSIVELVLNKHEEYDFQSDDLDLNGNSALHIAVKTKAPLQVLQAFRKVCGEHIFYRLDDSNNDAFQISICAESPDIDVITFIASVAPKSVKKPLPNGKMPAVYAAEKSMNADLVKLLLLADMPLHFKGKKQTEIKDVILRTHSYSWWSLCTQHHQYSDVISDILRNEANANEIVVLSQETDPDGFGNLFESSDTKVRDAFKRNLVFGKRYEILTNFRAVTIDGLVKLCAMDWGDRIAWEEFAGKGTSPQIHTDGYTTVEEGNEEGAEVVYYTHPQREVLLYCCLKSSKWYKELLEEMQARKQFNFSHLDSQRLYNIHVFDAQAFGCLGEMLCLSFERPLMTLQDVFDTSRFRKRKNIQWVRKSWNLLKRLAQVLEYFHTAGFVHGSVEPSTIAKFVGNNNWKLIDMRKTTRIGEYMRGSLRMGAPPESVSGNSLNQTEAFDQIKAVSFDETFNRTKVVDYETDEYNGPTPEFTPEDVKAHPTWDIFSFGLIMAQLLLGQSMVLLPNFERAEDAHLRRLYTYDECSLAKIVLAAQKNAGYLAADLLQKCLHPNPKQRLQSMDSVLRDDFFSMANF